jgi:serine/threonine-protein kinase PknK
MALTSQTSQAWLADAELGRRFSDVRLVRAGSRFTIYAAREPAASRDVALKVPDESAATWLHDVLRAEAAMLATIGGHPHVVTFYEQITLDDGRPALLLERCRGAVHDTLRADEPMTLRDVAAIGIKLAGALDTAHRNNIVHCDVRPGNVLITEWGEPVLAGFDEAARLTEVGRRPPLHQLTPHTAPELLEGNEPTTASDVYGLASTLYELVAGRAAFRAYFGESPARVIVRALSGPILPIVTPGVPLELSDLLTWALSPDPAKRPPSPTWLAEDLARIERRQGWPRTRLVTG